MSRRRPFVEKRLTLIRTCGTCGKTFSTTAESPWIRQVPRDEKPLITVAPPVFETATSMLVFMTERPKNAAGRKTETVTAVNAAAGTTRRTGRGGPPTPRSVGGGIRVYVPPTMRMQEKNAACWRLRKRRTYEHHTRRIPEIHHADVPWSLSGARGL
jgi:hypothetical protein